jgi:hypothetical protein
MLLLIRHQNSFPVLLPSIQDQIYNHVAMHPTLVVYRTIGVVATSCARESRRTDSLFTIENIAQMLHELAAQSSHLVGLWLRVNYNSYLA